MTIKFNGFDLCSLLGLIVMFYSLWQMNMFACVAAAGLLLFFVGLFNGMKGGVRK